MSDAYHRGQAQTEQARTKGGVTPQFPVGEMNRAYLVEARFPRARGKMGGREK
jgi:hypothetical protein